MRQGQAHIFTSMCMYIHSTRSGSSTCSTQKSIDSALVPIPMQLQQNINISRQNGVKLYSSLADEDVQVVQVSGNKSQLEVEVESESGSKSKSDSIIAGKDIDIDIDVTASKMYLDEYEIRDLRQKLEFEEEDALHNDNDSDNNDDNDRDDDFAVRLATMLPAWLQNKARDYGVCRFISDSLVTVSIPSLAIVEPEAAKDFLKLTREKQTVSYGMHEMQVVDLFLPKNANANVNAEADSSRGLVFFVHGGACQNCSSSLFLSSDTSSHCLVACSTKCPNWIQSLMMITMTTMLEMK